MIRAKKINCDEHGFTLIELMISLVLGLITVAAAISLYVVMFKGNVASIRDSQLNYDINAVLQLMTNDIRRAGYWGSASGAILGQDPIGNPFTAVNTDINLTTPQCITYSYDANSNGSVDLDELFGFRRESSGSISMRVSVAAISDGGSCTAGTWVPVTSEDGIDQISVSSFSLNSNQSSCDNTSDNDLPPYQSVFCDAVLNNSASSAAGDRLVGRRIIGIDIQASPSADSDIVKRASALINVSNDLVVRK